MPRASKQAERVGLPWTGSSSTLVNVQSCEEGGRSSSGLNEESLLHALVEMERQVGQLADNISWMKRCVKGKAEVGLGLGLKFSRPPVAGPSSGGQAEPSQVSGPKNIWREKLVPDISGQGFHHSLMPPIHDMSVLVPALKVSPVAVDHSGGPVEPHRREEAEEVTEGVPLASIEEEKSSDGEFCGQGVQSIASGVDILSSGGYEVVDGVCEVELGEQQLACLAGFEVLVGSQGEVVEEAWSVGHTGV